MPGIEVRFDTKQYWKWLNAVDDNRYRLVSEAELRNLGPQAYILTGNKSKEFGGGPSPDGFVLVEDRLIGRLRIADKTIVNGVLEL